MMVYTSRMLSIILCIYLSDHMFICSGGIREDVTTSLHAVQEHTNLQRARKVSE